MIGTGVLLGTLRVGVWVGVLRTIGGGDSKPMIKG
jgi:hypothetical protein